MIDFWLYKKGFILDEDIQGKIFGFTKKRSKKCISPRNIGLQLRINTHSVDNFVAHNVKIKYFRVAFE